MGQQHFLWIQILIAVFIIFLFLRRKKNDPSRLNLKEGESSSPSPMNQVSELRPQSKSQSQFQSQSEYQEDIKILNVMFMFNGHSFDAHEIIGVPPGSRFEVIREAFNKAVQKNPGQKEILIAAMSAIVSEVTQKNRKI
jgi:hypothetical protein